MPNVRVDRRLFLTADETELVEPDDPRAAFLWHNAGDEISDDEAERAGYTDGEPIADPATKQADEPENKAVEAPDEGDKTATAKAPRKARK